MTGENATRLVGWHPRADLLGQLEAEMERRGGGRGVQSAILNEALEDYFAHVEFVRPFRDASDAGDANREMRVSLRGAARLTPETETNGEPQ